MNALLLAAALQCHAPHGLVRGDLTSAQYRALYAYGRCVCPKGWSDFNVPTENPRSETVEHLSQFRPKCNHGR